METPKSQALPQQPYPTSSLMGLEYGLLAVPALSSSTARLGFSLFWRTFFLLAILILGSVLAWLKTVSVLEFEPRAMQTAHQIVSMLNITRTVLQHTHSLGEAEVLKTLAVDEGLRIQPRLLSDVVEPLSSDALSLRILQELQIRNGANTQMSPRVNGQSGMWVSVDLNNRPYWLIIDLDRVCPPSGKIWLIWLALAVVLSLAGAAILAGLINKPINMLWQAADRVREGNYQSSYLDEKDSINEIREVNIGFNRMASRIAKIDQDRAVMLAGISHDLRTPLSRLRLESEMYVSDENARAHMNNDIEQLDRTIDKFLEYARPMHSYFQPVHLNTVIEDCQYALRNPADMKIMLDLTTDLKVLGDAIELARIINNLLENARRYGKTPGTDVTKVEITGRIREHWVVLRVRDRGPGVPAAVLPLLTQAFFRGDAARTSAVGAGLGLSIVEKSIQRMGGTMSLSCPSSGGLAVLIRLNKVSS